MGVMVGSGVRTGVVAAVEADAVDAVDVAGSAGATGAGATGAWATTVVVSSLPMVGHFISGIDGHFSHVSGSAVAAAVVGGVVGVVTVAFGAAATGALVVTVCVATGGAVATGGSEVSSRDLKGHHDFDSSACSEPQHRELMTTPIRARFARCMALAPPRAAAVRQITGAANLLTENRGRTLANSRFGAQSNWAIGVAPYVAGKTVKRNFYFGIFRSLYPRSFCRTIFCD
jgi:hypothetical protein